MEFLRQYFWIILILTIILVSLFIVMLFIIINVCISKRAAWYSTQARPNQYNDTNFKTQNNQVHLKELEDERPPLPSRDQFKSKLFVDQSCEDLEPASDYEEVLDETNPPAPQQPTITPQYATVDNKSQDKDAVSVDYEEIEMPDDGEDYDDIV